MQWPCSIRALAMTTPLRLSKHQGSSSPLPSLDEISSRIKSSSTSTENVHSANASRGPQRLTNATSFIRAEPAATDLASRDMPFPLEEVDGDADDVCIIHIPAPGTKKARRKAGSGKLRELKPRTTGPSKPPPEAAEDKPWRKYLPSVSPEGTPKKTRSKQKKNVQEGAGPKSRHFAKSKTNDASEVSQEPKLAYNEPLALASAARRRCDWTPPPPDRLPSVNATAEIQEVLSSATPNSDDRNFKEVFSNLLQTYGRVDGENHPAVLDDLKNAPDVFRKRKSIETVSCHDSSTRTREPSPTKKAPQKKKPRTITELATAAYAVPDDLESELPRASILGHLDRESSTGKEKPLGNTGKKTGKRKTSKKNLGRESELEPVLLSPQTAIKQGNCQDFVFGTSSQLVTEHSPNFLRDLQAATRASNSCRDEDEPFVTPINSDAIEPEPRKKLWGVAARDDDGMLLDLPVIDLVNTPPADGSSLETNPFGYFDVSQAYCKPHDKTEVASEDSFPCIDDSVDSSKGRNARQVTEPPSRAAPKQVTRDSGQDCQDAFTPPDSTSSVDVAQMTLRPSIEGAAHSTQDCPAAASERTSSEPRRPKYELYTDAQLAKEVNSYGFKSIKRRTAMVALLGQCWDTKNRTRAPLSPLPSNQSLALSSTTLCSTGDLSTKGESTSPKRGGGRPRRSSLSHDSSNHPPPSAQPSAPTPKRGRGRPRKGTGPDAPVTKAPRASQKAPGTDPNGRAKPSAKSSAKSEPSQARPTAPPPCAPIEIPDSESEDALSPAASPQVQTCPSLVSEVEDELSLDGDTEMSLAAEIDQKSTLMISITKAVKAAPPSKDSKTPSWHEKMLMYDPIILEDFAAWLNTGPLTAAGFDGEVSPVEAKQWCESKSVCCLWRVNLSGKERKRY